MGIGVLRESEQGELARRGEKEAGKLFFPGGKDRAAFSGSEVLVDFDRTSGTDSELTRCLASSASPYRALFRGRRRGQDPDQQGYVLFAFAPGLLDQIAR